MYVLTYEEIDTLCDTSKTLKNRVSNYQNELYNQQNNNFVIDYLPAIT